MATLTGPLSIWKIRICKKKEPDCDIVSKIKKHFSQGVARRESPWRYFCLWQVCWEILYVCVKPRFKLTTYSITWNSKPMIVFYLSLVVFQILFCFKLSSGHSIIYMQLFISYLWSFDSFILKNGYIIPVSSQWTTIDKPRQHRVLARVGHQSAVLLSNGKSKRN